MPLIIFWLTPIVLVLVFLLVVFSQKPREKSKVFLVEPLLFLVGRWHLARFEGNETVLRRLLSYWQPGLEMQQSIVEQLVRQITISPPTVVPEKNLAILSQKTLLFWTEVRQIEQAGKTSSVIAGPISEVVEYCDADLAGPLTPEKRISWPSHAQTAAKNGFLTLALAEASSPDALLRKKFRLAGLLVLEPVLDDRAISQLRQAEALGKIRYLSVLPANLVEQIVEKVFPPARFKKISGEHLATLSPKEQENAVDQTEIFGEVGKKDRYFIARHLQRTGELNIATNLALDDDLPADRRL
ncbi:MAG: hypothetical protein WD544_01975 [Patescibacteria group bacterium]